jgi:hypothetical protein
MGNFISAQHGESTINVLVFWLALQSPQAVIKAIAIDDACHFKWLVHVCICAAICC